MSQVSLDAVDDNFRAVSFFCTDGYLLRHGAVERFVNRAHTRAWHPTTLWTILPMGELRCRGAGVDI
jgi:hypothetical protein